jgi:hypothetical protein
MMHGDLLVAYSCTADFDRVGVLDCFRFPGRSIGQFPGTMQCGSSFQGKISLKFRRIAGFSFQGDWRSNSILSLKLKLAPQTVPQDFPGALLCIPARKPPVPARKRTKKARGLLWNLLRLIVVV